MYSQPASQPASQFRCVELGGRRRASGALCHRSTAAAGRPSSRASDCDVLAGHFAGAHLDARPTRADGRSLAVPAPDWNALQADRHTVDACITRQLATSDACRPALPHKLRMSWVSEHLKDLGSATAAIPSTMSWLTDRLKAAEELLHRVDQTAATIGSKQRSGEPSISPGRDRRRSAPRQQAVRLKRSARAVVPRALPPWSPSQSSHCPLLRIQGAGSAVTTLQTAAAPGCGRREVPPPAWQRPPLTPAAMLWRLRWR